jgi:hypothetical protein
MVRRACNLLQRFFDQLDREEPKRAKAFVQPKADVQRYLTRSHLVHGAECGINYPITVRLFRADN